MDCNLPKFLVPANAAGASAARRGHSRRPTTLVVSFPGSCAGLRMLRLSRWRLQAVRLSRWNHCSHQQDCTLHKLLQVFVAEAHASPTLTAVETAASVLTGRKGLASTANTQPPAQSPAQLQTNDPVCGPRSSVCKTGSIECGTDSDRCLLVSSWTFWTSENAMFSPHSLVFVYYCRTYEKAVSGEGEREKGGHAKGHYQPRPVRSSLATSH